MGTKLANLEAIPATEIEKLQAAGFTTTDEVLARAAAKSDRAALATATGVPESVLTQLACTSDLMRIAGIGEPHALLLAALDTPTAASLATREALPILKLMRRKNVELMIARAMPPESTVARWIEDAKKLPPGAEV
jgi:predicted flap endonuclease-1-like 5' DNA nuclease